MSNAIVIIEVMAGVLPGTPEPEFTKRWAITSEEWDKTKDPTFLLAERNKQAQKYAAELMLRPDRLNWVRTDWLWL